MGIERYGKLNQLCWIVKIDEIICVNLTGNRQCLIIRPVSIMGSRFSCKFPQVTCFYIRYMILSGKRRTNEIKNASKVLISVNKCFFYLLLTQSYLEWQIFLRNYCYSFRRHSHCSLQIYFIDWLTYNSSFEIKHGAITDKFIKSTFFFHEKIHYDVRNNPGKKCYFEAL